MDKDRLNRIKRLEAIKEHELTVDTDRQRLLAATYKEIVSRNGLALEKLAKN